MLKQQINRDQTCNRRCFHSLYTFTRVFCNICLWYILIELLKNNKMMTYLKFFVPCLLKKCLSSAEVREALQKFVSALQKFVSAQEKFVIWLMIYWLVLEQFIHGDAWSSQIMKQWLHSLGSNTFILFLGLFTLLTEGQDPEHMDSSPPTVCTSRIS